jgi:rare lipoprotein A
MSAECRTGLSRFNPLAGFIIAVGAVLNVTVPVADAVPVSGDGVTAAGDTGARPHARRLAIDVQPTLDRSGRKRFGIASFYAKFFAGRKMADGTRMQPDGDNAASRTLPLGTTAKVTNLETGKSAVVTIRDRGPYIKGRIVDLSPATAQKIGLDRKTGVTEVAVAPIAVPQADGRLKAGVAGREANGTITEAGLSTEDNSG